MFKRQFYAVDHADNGDEPSSSDSSVNTGSDDDSAHEQDDAVSSPSQEAAAAPEGSEDSDEGEPESEDEEWSAFRDKNLKVVQPIDSNHFLSKKPTPKKPAATTTKTTESDDESDNESDETAPEEIVGDGVVLRIGGVLKCRYCVKIICLNDETMKTHLLSKGHARSLKQFASGKLKVQLNSDGEEDEEGETHAERLERVRKLAEEKVMPVKRKANSGRQRQRKRAKKRVGKAERALLKSAREKSG